MAAEAVQTKLCLEPRGDGTLTVRFTGSWRASDGIPSAEEIAAQLDSAGPAERVAFDASGLTAWDSGLLSVVMKIGNYCRRQSWQILLEGLPEGAQRLLRLAMAVPEKKDAARQTTRTTLLALLGGAALKIGGDMIELLEFVGSSVLSLVALVRGKAQYRRSDLLLTIQECGANALPIVSLISVLIGLILAFVGGVQLKTFGAQIYVADLVGLAMAREMAAIMTGVILAGRTGAAFAAQIGTMTVNEEVDALRTFGISPMEFLVLPRMLALAVMMPLLCLYADLMGILGGAVVGVSMPNVSLTQYLNRTLLVIGLGDVALGVFKGAVFGVLVAMSGCLQGMKCGRSSAAVGMAATSAVVTAIVLIIVTDAVFAVITNIIGI